MGTYWSSSSEPLITSLSEVAPPEVTMDHQWLEYLLRWVQLDAHHDDSISKYLDLLFEDLANPQIHFTHQQFMDRYMGIETHLFPLGQTAYEIIRSNYLLRDFREVS